MLNEMMYVRRNFRYAFISIGRDLAKLIMSVRMPISHMNPSVVLNFFC